MHCYIMIIVVHADYWFLRIPTIGTNKFINQIGFAVYLFPC